MDNTIKTKVIGVDINIKHTTLAVVDLRGTILAKDVLLTGDCPNINNFVEVLHRHAGRGWRRL